MPAEKRPLPTISEQVEPAGATGLNGAQNRTPSPIGPTPALKVEPAAASAASSVFVVHGFYPERPDHYAGVLCCIVHVVKAVNVAVRAQLCLSLTSVVAAAATFIAAAAVFGTLICAECSLAALSTVVPFLCFANALAGLRALRLYQSCMKQTSFVGYATFFIIIVIGASQVAMFSRRDLTLWLALSTSLTSVLAIGQLISTRLLSKAASFYMERDVYFENNRRIDN